MKPRWYDWIGPWGSALAITAALVVIEIELYKSEQFLAGAVIYIAAAVCVAWDASRIPIRDYETRIAHEPVILFVTCFVGWIMIFPWYIATREGIRRGLVRPKQKGLDSF